MSVDRTHVGHQTRYELRDEAGVSCMLTYTADPDEPSIWKILLPGPGGTMDLYGTERFPDPDAAELQAWLSPIVDSEHAAELAAAVDAEPPPAAWRLSAAGVLLALVPPSVAELVVVQPSQLVRAQKTTTSAPIGRWSW